MNKLGFGERASHSFYNICKSPSRHPILMSFGTPCIYPGRDYQGCHPYCPVSTSLIIPPWKNQLHMFCFEILSDNNFFPQSVANSDEVGCNEGPAD